MIIHSFRKCMCLKKYFISLKLQQSIKIIKLSSMKFQCFTFFKHQTNNSINHIRENNPKKKRIRENGFKTKKKGKIINTNA